MKATTGTVRRMFLASAIAAVASLPSWAATTITVDSVVQRWPWNNKVDITYTVGDGQDCSSSKFRKIVFTTVIDGTTYTIDGVSALGASANTGTHTVTWTLPKGVKSDGCTMSAAIYEADAPSGDDYMVIDLATGAVSYEGLLATQDDSNDRYNTATYKTDKLVLRKIPAGGPYPTGDSVNYAASDSNPNTERTWNTTRDYYIGVFPVTQAQYKKLGFSNPSRSTTNIAGNETLHRPVENISWDTLRNQTDPTLRIPAVESNTGTFFQRLNFKTGHYFDLPTEVMFEIAERAGASGEFWWGSDPVADYVISSDDDLTITDAGRGKSTVAVGMKKANAWGFFDMQGNVLEWCLDDFIDKYDNMASHADVFTPAWASGPSRRQRGSGTRGIPADSTLFRSSYRANKEATSTAAASIGFRVAFIAD